MNSRTIFLLLLVLLVVGFQIMPQREENAGLRTQAETTAIQLQNISQQFLDVKAAEKKTADDPEELLTKIPRTREQEALVRDIDLIGKRTGFGITQMTFSERKNAETRAGYTDITLIMEGNRKNVELFLLGIEQNPRMLTVKNLNAKLKGGESGLKATVSMTLQAFHQES